MFGNQSAAGEGKDLGLVVDVLRDFLGKVLGSVLGDVLGDGEVHRRSWGFVGARPNKTLYRFFN